MATSLCQNPQPGNVQFSYAQLEYIWIQAGGLASAAPVAAAIAMEESGGNSGATDCDSNGSIDRGLWQINSVHGSQSTYDVMGNARAAVAISSGGTNWGAWTSYSSGAYKRFVQTGVAPQSAPLNATNASAQLTGTQPSPPFGAPIPDSVSTVVGDVFAQPLKDILDAILNPLIQTIAGVLGVAAGGALVLVGIVTAVRNTETEQRMEQGLARTAQNAIGLVAPETKAVTSYIGQQGQRTTVSATRRPARQVRFGGRNVRFGQAQVRTDVQREGARTYGDTYVAPGSRMRSRNPVGDALNNEAETYAQHFKRTGRPHPGEVAQRTPLGRERRRR